MSVCWYEKELETRDTIQSGPVDTERSFQRFWCELGRANGLEMIPGYLDGPRGELFWPGLGGDGLDDFDIEIRRLQDLWSTDPSVAGEVGHIVDGFRIGGELPPDRAARAVDHPLAEMLMARANDLLMVSAEVRARGTLLSLG